MLINRANIRNKNKKVTSIYDKKIKLGNKNRFIGVKLIKFENNSNKKFIIKPSTDGLGFINNYNEELLKDCISRVEFTTMIKTFNNILYNNYVEKMKNEKKSTLKSKKKVYVFLIIAVVFGFICIEYFFFVNINQIIILYIGIISYLIAIIFSVIVLIQVMTKKYDIDYEEIINKKYDKLINDKVSHYNTTLFNPKKYNLVVGHNLFWLEIQNNNTSDDTVIYENSFESEENLSRVNSKDYSKLI